MTGLLEAIYSEHRFVEDAHKFTKTVGHGQQLAPGACFGNAQAMLLMNVGSDAIFGADQQHGEDTWIGVVEAVEVKQ